MGETPFLPHNSQEENLLKNKSSRNRANKIKMQRSKFLEKKWSMTLKKVIRNFGG